VVSYTPLMEMRLTAQEGARFVGAAKRGIACAEPGGFVEHDEVLVRIDRLLHLDASPLDDK